MLQATTLPSCKRTSQVPRPLLRALTCLRDLQDHQAGPRTGHCPAGRCQGERELQPCLEHLLVCCVCVCVSVCLWMCGCVWAHARAILKGS